MTAPSMSNRFIRSWDLQPRNTVWHCLAGHRKNRSSMSPSAAACAACLLEDRRGKSLGQERTLTRFNCMSDSDRFTAAIAQIDIANAADPNREVHEGREEPKELLYSRRMSDW